MASCHSFFVMNHHDNCLILHIFLQIITFFHVFITQSIKQFIIFANENEISHEIILTNHINKK